MKKISFIGSIILLWVSAALAGGIVTNTNQSAQFIRTLNRNASTSIDAAYFNPAGLTKLEDGFYLYLSNQFHFQTKEVTPSYPGLTLLKEKYVGDVKAFVFPDIHVAYKTGKLAFGGSFMPIGGGGSANFPDGIPSFEVDVAGLTALLAAGTGGDITGYRMDIDFEGASVYFGGQAGAAYTINDMFSVAVGGRYVMANNSYAGHVKDIEVNSAAVVGDWINPGSYLAAIGDPFAADPTKSAAYVTAATADRVVDEATKTGSGFTVIVGANIVPMDGLNIGFRYEHLTKLELETETDVDFPGVLEDGKKENYDMPAMVAFGASYMVMPQLKAEASFSYYLNTGVGWDGEGRNVENLENGFDGGLAIEYALSEALKVSAGFLYANTGVTDDYQTGLDFSMPSTTVAFGVGYMLSSNLALDLGALIPFYNEGKNAAGTETYTKSTLSFAVGVNYGL